MFVLLLSTASPFTGRVPWILIIAIGAAVGFFGGMFGKGGSSIATPLLAAVGVPAIVAVASPLPAAIPGLVAAYLPYRRLGFVDRELLRWTLIVGVPATMAGAYLSRFTSGDTLVLATEVIVAALGVRILVRPHPHEVVVDDVPHRRLRVVAVAVAVGLISGLLANAGGFLLVPLFLAVLKVPIKTALACSLAAAAVLAVPGTLVHAALGHIDWSVTVVFAAASVPLSAVGARVALRTRADRLEHLYGLMLVTVGGALLALHL
jgi:uncharacterized membrane protein YfcA